MAEDEAEEGVLTMTRAKLKKLLFGGRIVRIDTDENIFPLESDKIYDMPTPYNTFGMAKILMNKLETTLSDHEEI